MKISPLAPRAYAALLPIAGVDLATHECNIRYRGRPDVLLAALCEGTQVAGLFTRSAASAAPVDWCRRQLAGGNARGIVVNAGNANAFTGKRGMDSVERVTDAVAKALGCLPQEVFIASTGVIGEPLMEDKITAVLPQMKDALNPDGWTDAACAIMTTDTFMKVATRTAQIGRATVTLNGIAKGSGMIAPDMATLLAFVFTDAAIPAPVFQQLLAQANEGSFNSITVDGDTSTNDTLLAFATGKAGNTPILSLDDAHLGAFRAALADLLRDLAIQVVKDGEGAQKFVTIQVHGAEDAAAARRIALTIANSPLVKTAIAGEDANWGRIVAAVGRSGERVEQNRIEVRIGGVLVAKDGSRVEGFDEIPVAAHMKGPEIAIEAHLGIGKGAATVYTCDLTHGYIDINGSYRS